MDNKEQRLNGLHKKWNRRLSDTGGDSEKDSKEKIIGSPIIELEANKEMMDMHRKQKILDKKEKRKINTILQLKLKILQGLRRTP